ncbi:RidA family protein [Desulfopila inferna]|uniref:RidA family protein n=1 Tax=Desulfopila inferna TaxID=468528 RepID=UPI001964CCEA|nr:RidA family protein [Desulfopila inferna]MBM9604908.1 RidA family protein [Desulfopila inferna]
MQQEKKAIETSDAPSAIGPYSQAIMIGDLVFTSGQLPINPATGKITEGSITGQTHQALKNLRAVVSGAGGTLDDVVKTTVYLQNISDFQEVNSIYAEYFKSPFPARSAFQVAALPLGAGIEIEAIISIHKS